MFSRIHANPIWKGVLVCTFLLCCFSGSTQLCYSNDFAKTFTYPGDVKSSFTFQLPDKNFVFGGLQSGKLVILKATPTGNILWSKKYSATSVIHLEHNAKVRLDTDGTLVASLDGNYISKLDMDGNILSTIEVTKPLGSIYFLDLKVFSNGDKLLLYKDQNISSGHFLMRVSADLKRVLWTKHFSAPSSVETYFYNVYIDGNLIFLPGRVNENGGILSFDGTSGTLINQKWFQVNSRTVYFMDWDSYPDGYIARGYLYKGSSAYREDNQVSLRLDKSLNVISATRYVGINDESSFSRAVQPDGSYYAVYTYNGILYVSNKDSVLWSRTNYSFWLINAPTQIITGDDGIYITTMGNYYAVAERNYYGAYGFSRTDYNGRFSHCTVNEDKISLVSASVQPRSFTLSSNDTPPLVLTPVSASVSSMHYKESKHCEAVNICDRLQIAGPTTVCTSERVRFTGKRNAGCALPVQWQVEGDAVDRLLLNDSTISIQFLKSGRYRVIARLGGACTEMADTLQLAVTVSADGKPNLGEDALLCPGNVLTLNAKKGYTNYKWQDGSDDSVFHVDKPGIFYVEVQNACGEIFRDTIVITQSPPIDFNVGSDRIKCNSDTLVLSAPPGFLNYTWSHSFATTPLSSRTIVINPLTDITYFIKAEKTPGCFAYDTVAIKVLQSTPVYLGPDTSLCTGSTITLDAGSGFLHYRWSNGSTQSKITLSQKGAYAVKATAENGCTSTDTMIINTLYPLPLVNLNKDSFLCENSVRLLNAGDGYKEYLWNDGSKGQRLLIDRVGKYNVTVTDDKGCQGIDSTLISQMIPPPAHFLPNDTNICNYAFLQLKPSSDFVSYKWNTNATARAITVRNPGIFWLEVKDKFGCIGRDSITINHKQCLEGCYVPNAFTPNHDGKNDYFKPLLFGNIKSYRFTIYNRWGEKVFESIELSKGWDGTYKGKAVDSNVYMWVCQFQLHDQETQIKKGSLMVIR